MKPVVPLLLLAFSAPALAQPAAPLAPPMTPATTPPMNAPGAPVAPVPHPHRERRASLVVEAGSGTFITTSRAVANLFAADPKVAEVRPASPTSVFVFGIAPGRTTVAAVDEAGAVVAQYDVTVKPSAFGASEAEATIGRVLPGRAIRVETSPNGLVATGEVATAAEAEQVMAILKRYLPEHQVAENRLAVAAAQQVNLHVRVAEISRQVTRQIGINWAAIGSIGRGGILGGLVTDTLTDPLNLPNNIVGAYNGANASVAAVLDLLAQDGLVTVLAEPNLTAMSGETASFLAGGEFPIPVAQQNNTITIEFKQYGISLAFVPTVVGPDRISLKVRPEVSELTTQGAVSLMVANGSTLVVPALTVRRAETTVELGSGQSFAIAGMLQDENKLNNTGLPGIGETPVLGALFKSDKFQRNETELVIIITPTLVKPVSDPGRLRAPTDGYVPPGDWDRVALDRQRAFGTGPDAARQVPGDAGFILE